MILFVERGIMPDIIENEMVIIRSISDVLVSVNSSNLNRDTIPTLATIMRESAEKIYNYTKNLLKPDIK